MDTFLTLTLLIENPFKCFSRSYLNHKDFSILIDSMKSLNDKEFYFRDGYCSYCDLSSAREIDLTKKLTNKYSLCCNFFYYIPPTFGCIKIDETFIDAFKEIKDLKLQNTQVLFDQKKFKRLKKLTSLTLDNNSLNSIPLNAENLEFLSISGNQISNFGSKNKKCFKHLKHLKKLELNLLPLSSQSMSLTNDSFELIILPATLNVLKIKQTKLNCLPFDFKDCVNSIVELVFTGINWLVIDSFNKSFMKNRKALYESFQHILTNEEIDTVFNYFDNDNSGFLSVDEISKLNAFIFKKFPRLGDNFTAEDYDNNKTNKFLNTYLSIFELKNLRLLDLSYQAIQFIPDQIEGLVNLEKLKIQ